MLSDTTAWGAVAVVVLDVEVAVLEVVMEIGVDGREVMSIDVELMLTFFVVQAVVVRCSFAVVAAVSNDVAKDVADADVVAGADAVAGADVVAEDGVRYVALQSLSKALEGA